jgi:hypothetical protein
MLIGNPVPNTVRNPPADEPYSGLREFTISGTDEAAIPGAMAAYPKVGTYTFG